MPTPVTAAAAKSLAIDALPPVAQYQDGLSREIVVVPVLIEIPVDPLDGFTAEESVEVALERLAELPLQVTLGGVSLDVHAAVPLFPKP